MKLSHLDRVIDLLRKRRRLLNSFSDFERHTQRPVSVTVHYLYHSQRVARFETDNPFSVLALQHAVDDVLKKEIEEVENEMEASGIEFDSVKEATNDQTDSR